MQPTTPAKTPVQRGFRTLAQSAVGAFVGLLLTVYNVPGVPEAIVNYAQANFIPLLITLLGLVSVPSAIISFIQNQLETKKY